QGPPDLFDDADWSGQIRNADFQSGLGDALSQAPDQFRHRHATFIERGRATRANRSWLGLKPGQRSEAACESLCSTPTDWYKTKRTKQISHSGAYSHAYVCFQRPQQIERDRCRRTRRGYSRSSALDFAARTSNADFREGKGP